MTETGPFQVCTWHGGISVPHVTLLLCKMSAHLWATACSINSCSIPFAHTCKMCFSHCAGTIFVTEASERRSGCKLGQRSRTFFPWHRYNTTPPTEFSVTMRPRTYHFLENSTDYIISNSEVLRPHMQLYHFLHNFNDVFTSSIPKSFSADWSRLLFADIGSLLHKCIPQ
jgi:hypothetical protein